MNKIEPLDQRIIDRVFNRLIGIYGAQFKSKFSVVENGIDVGVANAKETWAHELRHFSDKLEAIGYGLEHLPTDHAPNAIEFRDICKRAPLKNEAVARVEYKPTEEEVAHHRALSRKVADAVKAPVFDGLMWAKKPKSQRAMEMVFDAKKNAARFPALASVFDQLVIDGICTGEGKLLLRWDGLSFVKA
jgi:hypothetical protein